MYVLFAIVIMITIIQICSLIEKINIHICIMDKSEKLKVQNILEVQKIQGYLKDDKQCLAFFNTLLKGTNKTINNDKDYEFITSEEEEEEPDLSDHESDDDSVKD
mgnify:CR=1 FL=1|jgi:hypothetical protein